MRIRLVARLIGLSLIGTVTVGIAAGSIFLSLNRVEAVYSEVALKLQPAHQAATALNADLHRMSAAARGYVLDPSVAVREGFTDATGDLQARLEQLRAYTDDPVVLQHVSDAETLAAAYTEALEEMMSLRDQGLVSQATHVLKDKVVPVGLEIVGAATRAANQLQTLAEEATREAQRQADAARLIGAAVTTLGAVLAVAIGIPMARSLANPIQQLSRLALQVAEGNLAVEELAVRGNDEVAALTRAVNTMLASLRTLIRELEESAATLGDAATVLGEVAAQATHAADEVAVSMDQVAEGGNSQAAAAVEVQKTMQMLQDAVRQVATGAEQTTGEIHQAVAVLHAVTRETAEMARSASAEAAAVLEGARSAAEGARAVQATTAGMSRVKEEIGNITTAISDIAGQTNLLALNAAIEAARAGEHGRGFAVVAGEVRRLAEGASRSAGEIAELVTTIQSLTAEVAAAMEAGLAEVEAGVQQAAEAGQALQRLQQASEQTTLSVERIARVAESARQRLESMGQVFTNIVTVAEENSAAAEEMAAQTGQVCASLDEVSEIARKNAEAAAAASEAASSVAFASTEVTAAARRVQKVAQQMREQVARFRTLE